MFSVSQGVRSMKLLDQPKPIFLLCFVELWNRFSHFGMRALLVLFMVKVLKMPDGVAFGVFATYCALDKLGGMLGAFLADKFIGLKRAVLWGGWIIALGHLSLALGRFFPGLALLIVGSSLFTTNIISLVGQEYLVGDPRRTGGYTLFYMGINIGALLATVLCGLLAETFGWEYGFGLAAIGMVIGNLALMKYGYLLKEERKKFSFSQTIPSSVLLAIAGVLAFFAISKEAFSLPLVPWIAGIAMAVLLWSLMRKKLSFSHFGIYLLAYICYVTVETQIGSSILVFADRMENHSLLGLPITTTSILAMNPIVIIFLGAMASKLYHKIGKPHLRLFLPFCLASLGFSSLFLCHTFFPANPMLILLISVAILSFGEILVVPIAYSACSEVSSRAGDTKLMSLIPLAYALASALGGGVGKGAAKLGYEYGFLLFAGGLLICAILFAGYSAYVYNRRIKI